MRTWCVCFLLAVFSVSGCTLNSPMPKPAPVVERPLEPTVSQAASKSSASPSPAAKASSTQAQYQVQKGDTLYGISKKLGVPISKLAQLNLLSPPYALQSGQVLNVAAYPSSKAKATPDEDAEVVTAAITPPDGKPATGTPIADTKSTSAKPSSAKPPVNTPAAAKEAPVANATTTSTNTSTPISSEPTPNAATIDSLSDNDIDWQWPIAGNVVANFDGQANKGLNIAGTAGQSVTVASAGKVIYSGADIRGYGKLVIVKHTSNLLSVYAHHGESLVKEGSLVKAQQAVATLPNTTSPAPVLHFEIRQKGKPVNPLRFLPAEMPNAE